MIRGQLVAAGATLAWLIAAAYGVAVLERLLAPPAGGRTSARAFVQPFASALTLLRARPLTPARPDTALFDSAPLLCLTTVLLAAWMVPLGPESAGARSSVSLFAFVVLLGPFVVALANAGWGGNAKHGLVGSMRAASHIIAYEVVLGFAILGPAMSAESLSLARIVEAQRSLWFVAWQPLGFALYLASVPMAIYRRPFDTPLAGSELAGGVLAEYGGARLLLLRTSLTALFFLTAAVGAATYLGGWHAPPVIGALLPGPVWMLLKTLALVALMLWLGRRTPRLGHDRMLAFSWKIVLPASFVNLALVGILILWLDP